MLEGQGDDYRELLDRAGRRSIHHAWLITGPRGSGKSTAARQLAAALFGGDPSGRVETGNHPDLHELTVPEDKQDIPIESVRDLQSALERSAVEAGARVVIIDPADRLNEQGQNALLKTLEEPGQDTFLLLPTSRPESLLDTVRSRVQRLRLRPLSNTPLGAAIRRAAGGRPLDPAALDWAVRVSRGSVGHAIELLGLDADGDPGADARELDATVRRALGSGQPPNWAALAREWTASTGGRAATVERARKILWCVAAYLRESLQVAIEQGGPLATAVEPGYVRPPSEPWTDALDAVFRAEEDLALKIGAGHAVHSMFLRLEDVLGRARV